MCELESRFRSEFVALQLKSAVLDIRKTAPNQKELEYVCRQTQKPKTRLETLTQNRAASPGAGARTGLAVFTGKNMVPDPNNDDFSMVL